MKKVIKVILLSFVTVAMTLAICGIVAISFPVLADLRESQQIRVEVQKEEVQKVAFYQKVEQICLKYVSGENETLNEKFNLFLEESSIRQDTILDYVKRLNTYNGIKNEEFSKTEEELKNALNNQQISEETFEHKKEILLNEYENSLNTIEDYLKPYQKEAFENSKDLIEDLFKLIELPSNN